MSTVFTLVENDYVLGAGALANSLHRAGFDGTLRIVCRGDQAYSTCSRWFTSESTIRGHVEIAPEDEHFAFLKPVYALRELSNAEAAPVFYFDPDIVVTAPWAFFNDWSRFGLSLVEEAVLHRMAEDNPIRRVWLEWANLQGFKSSRVLGQYFNSGFFGATQEHLEFFRIWQSVMKSLLSQGKTGPTVDRTRHNPFATWDQDALNLSLMLCDCPMSTFGPEGMGFTGTSILMLHATGPAKPWRKKFVMDALRGWPPTLAEKGWVDNLNGPIEVFPPSTVRRIARSVRVASAIGRFVRKT